jgi:ribosomal protein L18E
MTLRKVREFTDPTDARTARQLTRQVAEFEENVSAETAALRLATLGRLTPKDTATRESTVIVVPGESLGVDTTAASLEVMLERPSAKNVGTFAAVFKRVAANTLTLRADGADLSGGVSLINGASSLAVTAVGLTLLLSDGKNYWA